MVIGALIFLLGIIGLILSLKSLIKNQRGKEIALFSNLEGNNFEFCIPINNSGFFSVSIVGGKSVEAKDGFELIILNEEGDAIPIKMNSIMPRFFYKGKVCTEAFVFKGKAGKHTLLLKNREKLEVKKSMVKLKKLLEKPLKHTNLALLINDSLPVSGRLIKILSCLISAILLNIGIILMIHR